MSELLAIIVVVDSSRGHHFVLQYPNTLDSVFPIDTVFKETSFPSNKNRRADGFQIHSHQNFTSSYTSKNTRKDSIDKVFCDLSGTEKANSEISTQNDEDTNCGVSDSADYEETKFHLYDTVLGFDTSLISNIFSPKPALCNKRFQLGIQNLTFIGLPTQVDLNYSAPKENENNFSSKLEVSNDKLFNGEMPLNNFSQSPEAQGLNIPENSYHSYNFKNESNSTYSQITMFHIVFVIQPSPFKNNQEMVSYNDSLYASIITPYTAALKHEQTRCDYIGRNTEIILSLTEKALSQGHSRDVLMRNILQSSSLALEIAQIFQCVTEGTVKQLCINNYLHLALQVPTYPLCLPSYSDSNKQYLFSDRNRDANSSISTGHPPQNNSNLHNSILDSSLVQETNGFLQNSLSDPRTASPLSPFPQRQTSKLYNNQQRFPSFRPYHTLLLLDTPEDLLRTLPPDASPKLIRLIHILTPTQSLAELQIQLDCSLAFVYRLSAHLIYWRKARLIDVISVRNVYTLAPQKSHSISFENLSEEFSNLFPQMCLDEILAFLSMPRPFSLIIPDKEQRTLYLEVIAFLLRREVAAPLHTYIYFMIPQYIKKGYHTEDFERWVSQAHQPKDVTGGISRLSISAPGGLDGMAFDGIALVSNPSQMMDAEREWIKKVAHSQPSEVAALFQRLVKYFNGQYHVDEIVYFESITRKELRAILFRFREELITVLHYRGLGEVNHSS